MYNIRYGLSYLLHRFKANNRHGVHSPFVYKLIDTVIYDYRDQKVYREIEKILHKQHPDKRVIKTMPLKVYKLIYRFAVYFKPATVFFADHDDYIIPLIVGNAVPKAEITDIKDSAGSRQADMILVDAARHDATECLEKVIPNINDDTVLIFSGIHCTQNTKRAWERVKTDKRVRVTIDLFYIGLVFFKPGMSKEDFRVRY
ncbi:hypothetical protein SNE26_19215 [Mucilaginibacter sp. cycad4]|uniref:hypothetical protein n=1 Tax=Mucilaginibacter sp. cycad4 TaxID=3342096 RepID=UPI002AAA9CF4|nr:hypothetical protein [Mucilaginibacter gossypii]WPU98156.1 hypothetical protein SNE26_19215 [Mucilaginibacter gossypii]